MNGANGVVKITSRTVKTYTVVVENGDVRPQPFSRAGRIYRVHTVTVVKSDGNLSSVEFEGPVLKKDGTDGALWATERFYGRGNWPEWLPGIIGGLA